MSHRVRSSLLLLLSMLAGCARPRPAPRFHASAAAPAQAPPAAWSGPLPAPSAVSPAPSPVPSPATSSNAPREERPARSRAQVEAGIAAAKEGESYLPMLSQEEAREKMPSMGRSRGTLPNLVLVGGLLPKTMEAQMSVAQSLRREGALKGRLLNDVFWAVSSANDCFY